MAFCPKCGSPVDENAPFCANCGNRLGAPIAPPPYPANVNVAPKVPSKLGLAFKQIFTKGWVSPVEAAETSADLSPFAGLILVGGYALIAFFLMMIHVPLGSLSRYLGVGNRTLIGLVALLIICASVAVRAALALAFGVSSNRGVSFLNLLARLSVLKLYPFCAFFMMFLFGLFSPSMAIIFLALGEIVWNVLSLVLILKYMSNAKEVKKTWAAVVITVADYVASLLVFYLFYVVALSRFMSRLF